MPVPQGQKIYHIVHHDRLPSIIQHGCLLSDKTVVDMKLPGTNIGYSHIKEKRLVKELQSHLGLTVGGCVPFYFCPRSVMLYVIYISNPLLNYQGGQKDIVHLEFDLANAIEWAQANGKRWAFTTINAATRPCDDFADVDEFHRVRWDAVAATQWKGDLRDWKQAEFLVEGQFPWALVERIGIMEDQALANKVHAALTGTEQSSLLYYIPSWYY